MGNSVDKQALKDEARRLGFELVGVTELRGSDHAAFYRDWLENGRHGEMRYLARADAVRTRLEPDQAWPELRTAVVVAHNYAPDGRGRAPSEGSGEASHEAPYEASGELSGVRSGNGSGETSRHAPESHPEQGIIARYARGRDYHRVVRKKLMELLRWVEHRTGESLPAARAYVDTGPVLERELARRAGLGWFGRNTMIINPRRGSYFFLGSLLLPFGMEPDEPFTADRCGTCSACVDACPTGALLGRDENGAPVMDATRCISYLTIEQKGPIPEELRPLMGNRVYGCDICQEVCPWNSPKMVQITGERDYGAGWRETEDRPDVPADLPGTESPSLVELMRMTREEWDLWTRGSAIRRAGYAGFRRNVAVAMGNWLASVDEPPAEAVAVLREALDDEEPLVREHAEWAIGRAAEA